MKNSLNFASTCLNVVDTRRSSSATIAAGQTANFTVAITPAGGFNHTVTLSCTGAPAGSTCTVPSQVTLNGSSASSVPVSVSTLPLARSLRIPLDIGTADRLKTVEMGAALILLLIRASWFASRQQQALLARRLLILIIISGSLVLYACGGGSSSGGSGTRAGTYALTITANFQSGSTNLSHQTNPTLVVQ